LALGHPYLLGMWLLLAAGAAAWRLMARSTLAALNVYGWGALLAILVMAWFEAAAHPDLEWTGLALIPFAGVVVLGHLGRDCRSTLAYTLGALGTLAGMGVLYGEIGATAVWLLATAVTGGVLWGRCDEGERWVRTTASLWAGLEMARGQVEALKGHLDDMAKRVEALQ
jgi:hypothetical protein